MIDPDLAGRIDSLGTVAYSGRLFRHTASSRNPLSGEGARMMGGRWNPPGSFPTIYLASPIEACIAEFYRMAEGQARGTASFVGRVVHEIEVRELAVLDLRTPERLHEVGLSLEHVSAEDRTECQRVAENAEYLKLHGILAPSATGIGLVLAVFERRVGRGQLEVLAARELAEYMRDER